MLRLLDAEKKRNNPSVLKTCRLDLGFAYFTTAIFGLAMVIIGSTIQVEGTGSKLIVNLADKLTQPLGLVGRWTFLVGAWGAVFSSLFGVWQAVSSIFVDFCNLVQKNMLTGQKTKLIVKDSIIYIFRSHLGTNDWPNV